jgi:hypothetical protein
MRFDEGRAREVCLFLPSISFVDGFLAKMDMRLGFDDALAALCVG